MASNFFLSSSPVVLAKTWCRSSHASMYDFRAPSKFCALSNWTAVFALANALESIAFCDGFDRFSALGESAPPRTVDDLFLT